jgi:hypothetical protein
MKRINETRLIAFGASLFAGLAMAHAADINVPDGNFQNVNAMVTPPLIGTANGSIGAWSVQYANLAGLDGQIASSNAATANWPAPPYGSGSYELEIALPASVDDSATLSQALTNLLQPNSVYTLSVEINQEATANLLSGSTLSLVAVGSTNLASIGGTALANLFTNLSGFQTVTLTYKTGNTVPTNAIGISFEADGLANLGGDIFLDNFQLAVNPIQVQMGLSFAAGHPGQDPAVTVTGQGGAPGATYEIITSRNLQVPSTSWTMITTNTFDTNGNYSQIFTVDPHIPYRFYRTVLP